MLIKEAWTVLWGAAKAKVQPRIAIAVVEMPPLVKAVL
jgi:hypothetical protein